MLQTLQKHDNILIIKLNLTLRLAYLNHETLEIVLSCSKIILQPHVQLEAFISVISAFVGCVLTRQLQKNRVTYIILEAVKHLI